MLACGCWKEYPTPVAIGEAVYCRKHAATFAMSFGTDNWHIACQTCKRYNRYNLGAAPLTARTKGTTHALRLRHRVRIWNDAGTEEFIDPNRDQIVIDDIPPF